MRNDGDGGCANTTGITGSGGGVAEGVPGSEVARSQTNPRRWQRLHARPGERSSSNPRLQAKCASWQAVQECTRRGIHKHTLRGQRPANVWVYVRDVDLVELSRFWF